MSSLTEVYGNNFQTESQTARIDYIINHLVNNISNRQFTFRTQDYSVIWTQSGQMTPMAIGLFVSKLQSAGFAVKRLLGNDRNIIKYLQPPAETAVEYFLIGDSKYKRSYIIFVTPFEVGGI